MKFKCKQSGTIIELFQDQDIKTTLTNPAYEVYNEPLTIPTKDKAKKQVVESVEE